MGQGTGLGLATVYGIVKQTGGFITVDSAKSAAARRSRSTCRAITPSQPPRRRAGTAAPRDIPGEDTILLVEDEEAVRSFAARALKLRGYNVLEAAGGEEALEIVQAAAGTPIHLLITDVVMPNMDGPTLVRAVQQASGPTWPSSSCRAMPRRRSAVNDEKAEELHFLPKPFGLKQLAAKVKDVLSHAPAPRKAG